jgi:hypothetical protein
VTGSSVDPATDIDWFSVPAARVRTGLTVARLLAHPRSWIRRRVETIELLTREETRRRVSIDFALDGDAWAALETDDGLVVPIAVLTKEPRRNFDLQDESCRSLPALGRRDNIELSSVALMTLAAQALPEEMPDGFFDVIGPRIERLVSCSPDRARTELADFYALTHGDATYGSLWESDDFVEVASALAEHYVLFAVLDDGGPRRRVLKYSYGDDFDVTARAGGSENGRRRRFARVWRTARDLVTDDRPIDIACRGAARAASFHVEVAIPEELRVQSAQLVADGEPISEPDENVNRASLYVTKDLGPWADVRAEIVLVAERSGQVIQAAITSGVAAALLWLGVITGLDIENPGSVVSILLAGTALYSGVSAASGDHRLVRTIFRTRRWMLTLASFGALVGSAALAFEIPCERPVDVWWWAAVAASIAAGRLSVTAIRAPA